MICTEAGNWKSLVPPSLLTKLFISFEETGLEGKAGETAPGPIQDCAWQRGMVEGTAEH